jgi:hypothetical protein
MKFVIFVVDCMMDLDTINTFMLLVILPFLDIISGVRASSINILSASSTTQ